MKGLIILILFIVYHTNSTLENVNHRVKRKVLFTKNSKLFFRLNGKDNIIPWTQIFAQGWAFRINWELPNTIPKRQKFFKREVRSDFENFSNISGYSCILKYLCSFANNVKTSSKCGIFCEIRNIISRAQGMDTTFFQSIFENCDDYNKQCSLSF